MKRSEANKQTEAQLQAWAMRNHDPGALTCVPVVMISSLCGGRPGITINIANGMKLEDVMKVLTVASEQVRKQMEAAN